MADQGIASDVLVVGGGPAALCIAAAMASEGLRVVLLAPHDPRAPWPNTYGIWGDEVDALGLAHLLAHRWSNTVSYFGAGDPDPSHPANQPTAHHRDYGLFDKLKLQEHWLTCCDAHGVQLLQGTAQQLRVESGHAQAIGDVSVVTAVDGSEHYARLVVDATGHAPLLVRRPDEGPVAGQAAYGIVGRFSIPPVETAQFVLMDYRSDHLTPSQRQEPPTFLYAMDLGEGRFFVEETSLALAPPVPYDTLKARLLQRLAHRGIDVLEVEHEEFCLFPMNLPLPDLKQPVLGFGGAASMVHPASGYMVGSLLRRAPGVAAAVKQAMVEASASPAALADSGWLALWSLPLRRKHALYQFGLEKLMRFPEGQLRAFFATFFALPGALWYGFLANTLTVPELVGAMVQLFFKAPWMVRWGLMGMRGRELQLGVRLLRPVGSS
ncbi:lycopene cyclase family protein [Synechococcus sp. FGCU-3]|nr:lycopene cyclase family protein [Synechococcus sp. FGCU3]